jgi:hypothetical protein
MAPPGFLVLRAPQILALKAGRLRAFEDWMVDHLRRHFAEWVDPDDEPALRAFVRAGTETALSYDIERLSAVCKLIDLMLVLGEGFVAETPLAEATLRDATLAPDDRVELLARLAVASLRAASPSPGPARAA